MAKALKALILLLSTFYKKNSKSLLPWDLSVQVVVCRRVSGEATSCLQLKLIYDLGMAVDWTSRGVASGSVILLDHGGTLVVWALLTY